MSTAAPLGLAGLTIVSIGDATCGHAMSSTPPLGDLFTHCSTTGCLGAPGGALGQIGKRRPVPPPPAVSGAALRVAGRTKDAAMEPAISERRVGINCPPDDARRARRWAPAGSWSGRAGEPDRMAA